MCGHNGNKFVYLMAGSGKYPAKVIYPRKRTADVPKILTAFDAPDSSGNVYDRSADAEFKLLNILAGILLATGENYDDETWVKLKIEQAPCLSCKSAIQEFRRLFPRIKVDVTIGKVNVRSDLKNIVKAKIGDSTYDPILTAAKIAPLFRSHSDVG
jgi:hypothetical protein